MPGGKREQKKEGRKGALANVTLTPGATNANAGPAAGVIASDCAGSSNGTAPRRSRSYGTLWEVQGFYVPSLVHLLLAVIMRVDEHPRGGQERGEGACNCNKHLGVC